jgi:hypothetical protein
VTLQVTQNDFLYFAAHFQVNDLGVNGFLVELMNEFIVRDTDLHGVEFTAVNDCWNQALVSQAAARTFP